MKELGLWFADARASVVREVMGRPNSSRRVILKGTKATPRRIDVFLNGILIGHIQEMEYWGRKAFDVECANRKKDILRHIGIANSVLEAKKKIMDRVERNASEEKMKSSSAVLLPASPDCQFYPTPSVVAGKMLATIDWKNVRTVLEPSAGKGDLLFALKEFAESYRSPLDRRGFRVFRDCDVVEKDPNLQMVLRGNGFRLVGDDFLEFSPRKQYDLILMNPPFADGDKHLLKAISLQEISGGQICCVLNANTIRCKHTASRQLLATKLAQYGANIRFFSKTFRYAERPTDVEIAIVTVKIPAPARKSRIVEEMRRATSYKANGSGPDALVSATDWVEALIQSYNLECESGIRFLREYIGFAPYIMNSESAYAHPIIQLKINDSCCGRDLDEGTLCNDYLKAVREKYWRLLMYHNKLQEVTGAMPSAMTEEYRSKVEDMSNCEFDHFNIRLLILDIQMQLHRGMEEAIVALFDKLSAEHSYLPETSSNRWYYTGWKTNKAHKVGMKAIIPVNGCYADSWRRELLDTYRITSILSDIEKVMDFLDGGKTEFHSNLSLALERANRSGKPIVDCTYFTARFYKKGTCHIKFKEEARHIVDRLNIFAGSKYNWLPPTYGKKNYDDLTSEEREVIDSFQGREEYEKVVANPSDYLIQPSSTLLRLT